MKLKWYGHAAFRITSSDGLSIITDPYTPELAGYPPISETCDMVITSSADDVYHCRADLIPDSPLHINALEVAKNGGTHQTHGLTISTTIAKEMEEHPYHAPGQNAMYRFEVDGIKIAHMGDVGNPFTQTQLDFLQDVDIFLALVGDIPTMKLVDLVPALEIFKPKLIVPMHFRTLTWKPRDGFWIEAFLSHFEKDQIDFAFDYEIELSKADIPDSTRILVLDYVR